jgi:IclR family pca regulon transcriptional regulator
MPTAEPPEGQDREFVQSLARGLSIIQAFGAEREEMTLSEVAAETGLSRAAARRFLHTLQALGFVGQDGKRFFLRPPILCLGYAYLSSVPWWRVAEPFMEEVAASVHESCSASVLDGHEIVYLARVPTRRIMSVNLSIGSRLPAYCTSMGRMLLAHLPPDALDRYFAESSRPKLTERTETEEKPLRRLLAAARAEGYCLVDQELDAGVCSLAVPILDRAGRCIAALNVGANSMRFSGGRLLAEVLPVLQEASSKITRALPS